MFLIVTKLRNKKGVIAILIALSISVIDALAQKSPQFSQYMEYQSAINPAAVAADEMMSVGGVYRLQWVGFDDAPKNLFFSMDYPFRIGDTRHGVGLIFSSDDIGLFKNQSVLLQYSYKFALPKGEMSLGLNVGFINQKFDKEGVDLTGGDGELMEGDEYHQTSDPFIDGFTAEDISDVTFDASFGCMYKTDSYYVGFSMLHIMEPKIDLGTEQYMMYIPRSYHLMGGYTFNTNNPEWTVTPSAYIKTDLSTWQVDVTGLLEYSKRIRGGISYRFGDAFVFLFGIDIIQGLRLGYSYDLPTSKMIRSGGSHEVSLHYYFKPQFAKKNKYKSDRIL